MGSRGVAEGSKDVFYCERGQLHSEDQRPAYDISIAPEARGRRK